MRCEIHVNCDGKGKTCGTLKQDWERNIERLTGECIPYDPEFFKAWTSSPLPLKPFIVANRNWVNRLLTA